MPCGRGPFFKIEKVAEKLERRVVVEQAQPECAAKMPFQNGGRLLQVSQHSRRVGSVLLWPLLKCHDRRRFQREAPVQVDPPEGCRLFEKCQPIMGENLSDRVWIFPLSRKFEPRHHARVLIQAGSFRHSAQCAFDRTRPRVEFLVR